MLINIIDQSRIKIVRIQFLVIQNYYTNEIESKNSHTIYVYYNI